MKWQGRRESQHVEDRRGAGGGRRIGVGGGIGGLVLLLLFAMLTDQNPLDLLSGLDDVSVSSGMSDTGAGTGSLTGPDDEAGRFMRVVLANTEDTWTRVFADRGTRYEPPALVLFSESTPSACGLGDAAMGPFYCPGDRKVYLDLSFFEELDRRFGAPGDFAQAYVVAHEVGHHIQTLTGISDRVSAAQRRAGEVERNALSVRQELQADCYAGVWGYFASREGMLDPGDVDEGLTAAAAIGDDRLQRQSQGRVVPESFTHGTSAQRVEWFLRGLSTGNLDRCDTFQQ